MSYDIGCFWAQGKLLPYFWSMYNTTMQNERAIEVPIVLDVYSRSYSTLEIGCVLPHYIPAWEIEEEMEEEVQLDDKTEWVKVKRRTQAHVCVDLTEKFPGVINKDINKWSPAGQKFDLIISISTLEHTLDGRKELNDEDRLVAFVRNLERMQKWLKPGGLMLITLPWGQPKEVGGGEWVDRYIESLLAPREVDKAGNPIKMVGEPDSLMKFNRQGFGRAGNIWKQVSLNQSPNLHYNTEIPSAGTVWFLMWGDFWRWWNNA